MARRSLESRQRICRQNPRVVVAYSASRGRNSEHRGTINAAGGERGRAFRAHVSATLRLIHRRRPRCAACRTFRTDFPVASAVAVVNVVPAQCRNQLGCMLIPSKRTVQVWRFRLWMQRLVNLVTPSDSARFLRRSKHPAHDVFVQNGGLTLTCLNRPRRGDAARPRGFYLRRIHEALRQTSIQTYRARAGMRGTFTKATARYRKGDEARATGAITSLPSFWGDGFGLPLPADCGRPVGTGVT